ncbi:MAG: aspartate aminotransferase family protein [Spirochaetes bacterium]|nr:MAG: aspartate aminotransferase family protein [Spirochaetota bacterium]
MSAMRDTMATEDRYAAPFFQKIPVSFERGEGVYVWDEDGKRYLDLTAGWGVTSLGHAHPVITKALCDQAAKIIQNPNSGASYSPIRAKLLALMKEILPANLDRVFFQNSGAEANDAAIKLARKASGRPTIISTDMSFHGRTISTASATGQESHRGRYNPLMPGYVFVPYGDLDAAARAIDENTAAVIVEPVQGEGGIVLPPQGYLQGLSALCAARGVYLIIDEIQTGFCRIGPMFASGVPGVCADFLTMAKGIAGGYPFAAFAMTQQVADRLSIGDHGGTYCGNPLGCAVAYAVIRHMLDTGISAHVAETGEWALRELHAWEKESPGIIAGVRGLGLLIAIDLADERRAVPVRDACLRRGLVINITQKRIIRLFPALTVTKAELTEGLVILKEAISDPENAGK